MTTKRKLGLFVLLAALAMGLTVADARAQCCGTPSYGVAYQTYSPVVYTANYQSSSWYPGCCLFRWCSSLWGGGYTASYAPTYSTSYRPAYYASYAPTSSYSTCSPCTTCYAPSCTTCYDSCSTCPTGGCTTCTTGCSTCGVTQASATESYPMESYPSDSYPSGNGRPTLDQSESPALERTFEKPVTDDEDEVYPKPADDTSDESASFYEAPLLNPKDQTARQTGSIAPVHTAVYHKPAAGGPSNIHNASLNSRRQAEIDAIGWTSVVE